MAFTSTNYYRGQGSVFMAKRDSSGQTGGFYPIGDAGALSISHAEQFAQIYEDESGARVKADQVSTQLDVNFSMTIKNLNGVNIARAVLGETAAVASGTVASESLKAFKGSYAFTKYPKVSSVAVKDSTGATTYVAGTDYTVDADSGAIKILEAGAITDGSTIKVSYTHASIDAYVEALTDTTQRNFIILFAGKNVSSAGGGQPVIVRMHNVYLNLPQTISLIGSDYATFETSGALNPAPELAGTGLSQFYTWQNVSEA